MFRFRFVVHIFIRTQYLHFPASCSSKKTKARKNKGEINAELKQTGFCFCFFQQQAGYVMRRIRRETLQIGDWISFQSVHPHQLMHLFLYASSASENWIMEVFRNVLLLPSEINIYIYIYTHIYMLPPTKNIFIYFLCYWSLFVHTHFDGQLKTQLSFHQPVVWQLCPSLQWACIIRHIFFRNNLWMCYRIGHHSFYLLLLLLHLHIWKMHKCILSVLAIKTMALGPLC